MYCKHCGKEIADDSKFCQHCGGKIDEILESSQKDSEHESNDSLKADTAINQPNNNFFVRYRWYIVLYIVWVTINLLLFLQGESHVYEETKVYDSSGFSVDSHTYKASDVFYPFTSTGYRTSNAFNVKYYDATEFLVYCLLLPLIIYVIIIVLNSSLSKKIVEESKPKLDNLEQDKLVKPNSEITRLDYNVEKEIVFEPSEVKETSTATEGEESLIVVDFVLGAIKISITVLISFAVFVIALMYLRNIILGCLLSLIAALLSYLLIRWNRNKEENESDESKDAKSPLYYLGMVIFTLFLLFLCYKIGESMILNKINTSSQNPIDKECKVEKPISLNEQLRSEIKITKTKLPIVIDEYLSWANVRVSKDGVLFDYLIDDANFDLYEIDLDEYKEEITESMKTVTNKRFLELCVLTNKSIHYRLTSQWDNNKSVRITFGVYELADMAGINPKEPYGKESSESRFKRRLNEIKGRGGPFDSELKQTREQINELPSEKEYY